MTGRLLFFPASPAHRHCLPLELSLSAAAAALAPPGGRCHATGAVSDSLLCAAAADAATTTVAMATRTCVRPGGATAAAPLMERLSADGSAKTDTSASCAGGIDGPL